MKNSSYQFAIFQKNSAFLEAKLRKLPSRKSEELKSSKALNTGLENENKVYVSILTP